MRLHAEVSEDKLRGGFYTPLPIVNLCLDRIASLTAGRTGLELLEPSAGDGAFLQGLRMHPMATRVASATAVEISASEAAKIPLAAKSATTQVSVVAGSVLEWIRGAPEFDVVVGNPPYVRFQFVTATDRASAAHLMGELGVRESGVGNLWIPVFLSALARLRVGGAFAIVLPTELLTGVSAGAVRSWLLANTKSLRIDLFEPGSFPAVLQEVAVISGLRAKGVRSARRITFVEHERIRERRWSHEVTEQAGTWTRYLLSEQLLNRVEAQPDSKTIAQLGSVAAFEVSIVTGANAFFCVSSAERDQFCLGEWAVPLLPRIRHARGLRLLEADLLALQQSDAKAWLLDFSGNRRDPATVPLAAQYLAIGEAQGLHTRFKTRIRTPWYRVPGVRAGEMMLSKRSHSMPRVVLNTPGATTTDTIYRGRMREPASLSADAFVAGFHNSLTLLAAEIEGRSFGGGVLELVPSEVARLPVPNLERMSSHLVDLDRISRGGEEQYLVQATNRLLTRLAPELNHGLLEDCENARSVLQARRFARN